MSSDEEDASHVIVFEDIHRLGESLFLEVGMSTTGSLPLTKREALHSSVFFMVQLSHSYMATGKKHSFDNMGLCQQTDISAF